MSENLNILVSGSRKGFSYLEFKRKMLELYPTGSIQLLIFGCAKGVDAHVLRFAKEFDIPYKLFKADWDSLGKKAGIVRNAKMFDYLLTLEGRNIVAAFRVDMSRGTSHMVLLANGCDDVHLDLVEKSSSGVEFD